MFAFKNELLEVILLKRYKRFLVDVALPDGTVVTAHCPNTGSMKTCFAKGWKGYVSKSDNPQRKLPYTLELVHDGNTLIGVHPAKANEVVYKGIKNGEIEAFNGLTEVRREVPYGPASRIDIRGKKENILVHIEVKSVSMLRQNRYVFPDAITRRGQKHLSELMEIKKRGHRACMFFLVVRNDGEAFEPAWEIDPTYSKKLYQAFKEGVEVYAYEAQMSLDKIAIGKRLELKWDNILLGP